MESHATGKSRAGHSGKKVKSNPPWSEKWTGAFEKEYFRNERMDGKTKGKRKREVTHEEFRRLLARLDLIPVRAWQKYDDLRRKLVMFFGPQSAAEDLADEVLDRIAKKPDSENIINVAEFAAGIARNVRRENWQKTAITLQMPEDLDLPDRNRSPESSMLETIDGQRKRECYSQCMRLLAPEDRRLILEYHPAELGKVEESRQELAASLAISNGALRSRVGRLRASLEDCCRNCYDRPKPGR